MEFKQDIKPSGFESAVAYAPFDEALGRLEKESYRIISTPENAELRIQQGSDAFVSRNGNYVREGVLYIPQKGGFLVRNSPILTSARQATQAHRDGKEFYATQEQVDEALKDSVKFPEKYVEIPVKRFGEDELTVFVIGGGDSKKAEVYGNFLKDAGIKAMPVYVVDKDNVNEQNTPFARQLWFWSLVGGSVLDGDGRDLGGDCGVRGVRLISGEASTQKISDTEKGELYTARNLKDALNIAGITGGVEKLVFESLNRKH